MKYIDTHAHLNLPDFDTERDEIAEKTKQDGVWIINVGTNFETSLKACELSEKHDHMYSIIGLHPIYTVPSYDCKEPEAFDEDAYQKLVDRDKNKNIVAVGECGLDYFHGDEKQKEQQQKVFRQQVDFALKNSLPLMLHIRPTEGSFDAYEDVLSILEEYSNTGKNLSGDVHFFAGNEEIAQRFLDLGFYISFTGVITFARMYEKLVKYVPLDRILSETDAPYVAPVPFRGKRNEPSHVREVVKKIAKIKKLDEEVIGVQIKENAQKLFKRDFFCE